MSQQSPTHLRGHRKSRERIQMPPFQKQCHLSFICPPAGFCCDHAPTSRLAPLEAPSPPSSVSSHTPRPRPSKHSDSVRCKGHISCPRRARIPTPSRDRTLLPRRRLGSSGTRPAVVLAATRTRSIERRPHRRKSRDGSDHIPISWRTIPDEGDSPQSELREAGRPCQTLRIPYEAGPLAWRLQSQRASGRGESA